MDDAAVTFRLAKPDPDLAFKLAMPFAFPLPPSVPMEEQGFTPLPATGPYMVEATSEEGIELVRNPEFEQWSGAAQPDGFVDAISWSYDENGDGALEALTDGTIDWTTGASPEDIESLRLDESRPGGVGAQLHALLRRLRRPPGAVRRRPRPPGGQLLRSTAPTSST